MLNLVIVVFHHQYINSPCSHASPNPVIILHEYTCKTNNCTHAQHTAYIIHNRTKCAPSLYIKFESFDCIASIPQGIISFCLCLHQSSPQNIAQLDSFCACLFLRRAHSTIKGFTCEIFMVKNKACLL